MFIRTIEVLRLYTMTPDYGKSTESIELRDFQNSQDSWKAVVMEYIGGVICVKLVWKPGEASPQRSPYTICERPSQYQAPSHLPKR